MACSDELAARGYREDRQHLRCLDPTFASKVNVVLCVSVDDNVVGFPVHNDIISAYSPVLCRVLEDLQQDATNVLQQQQAPIRLPMVDDSYSTVQASLSQMYSAFTHTEGSKQASPEQSASPDTPQTHADHLRFYRKYGMTTMLKAAEARLKCAVEACFTCCRNALYPYSQTHTEILDFINVAEEGGSLPSLYLCEAFVATYFEVFASHCEELSSKLSSASMCRVYQGIMKTDEMDMQAMDTALDRSTAEAQKLLYTLCQHGMTCPRCDEPMELSKKGNGVHKNRNSPCKWPRDHTYTAKYHPLAGIAAHLATL